MLFVDANWFLQGIGLAIQGFWISGLIADQSTSDTKVVAATSQVNCNYALIFIYGIYLPLSKAPKHPLRKLTKTEM